MPEEKRLMVVYHSHRFGSSSYIIRVSSTPSIEEVIKKLGINFEEKEGEFIELHDASPEEPIEFP